MQEAAADAMILPEPPDRSLLCQQNPSSPLPGVRRAKELGLVLST